MKPKYIHSNHLKKPDDSYAITRRFYKDRLIDKTQGLVPIWLGTLKIGMQYPVEIISRQRDSKEVYWSRKLPKLEPYKTIAKLERKAYWDKYEVSC